MELRQYQVPVERLQWQCDPNIFHFECTKEIAPLREFIGQDRATRAVEFGLNMENDGYNIYVAGPTGIGKTSMVKHYIERLVREKEAMGQVFRMEDWCYIYNFREPDCPLVVSLAQGQGRVFQQAMADLLGRTREGLGRALASEDYESYSKKTVEEGREQQQRMFRDMGEEARQNGFTLQITPMGPVLIPTVDGRPMEEREFLALDEKTRTTLETRQTELRKKLQASFEKMGEVQRQTMERLHQGEQNLAESTIARLFDPVVQQYSSNEKIVQYLTGLRYYVLDDLAIFKSPQEPVNPLLGMPVSQAMAGRDPFAVFKVNLFVDNSGQKGPAVIIEAYPNFGNVFGKIERRFLLGGYLSDHTMVKSGALSRANGGFLLMNARDVLTNPGVWPALKRAIQNKEARIEDPFEQFGLIAPQGMRPEPMPISVKIVLIGDPMIYNMLSAYDEDFWEIFKVKADFAVEIEKTEKNMLDYIAFISGCCDECQARHFDRGGAAKILEYSSRMVADQQKLSARFAQIKELVEEANYWAKKDNSKYITAQHVKKSLDEKLFRHNMIDEKIREMIDRGVIMIDVGGVVTGQVNGLSVYSLGDGMFGRPARITAKTFAGRAGVINIERESELSGPIHNKGVMILSGYLGWKYAQDKPLSLSASLCFEQSYEGVEGDSASSAELYAILSSISGVPIKQNLAVTGSVNQKGEIQPIGGVNHKIEGFFRVCRAKGLTGDQGVVIPHQNIDNLMLREEVIEAVKSGLFNVYAVRTIDEGLEVLTGVTPGQRKADGSYPPDSVNYLVDQQLRRMAEKMKEFRGDGEGEAKHDGPRRVAQEGTMPRRLL